MGICSACTGLLLCIRPIFMEVFLLKNNTKKLLCILLAIAAAVCVIFACFMLTKHKQTDSASSALITAMVWTKTAIGAASKRWIM